MILNVRKMVIADRFSHIFHNLCIMIHFNLKSNLILRTVVIINIILIIIMFFLYRPYSWPFGYEAEGCLLSVIMLSAIVFLLWKQRHRFIDELQKKNVSVGLFFGLIWMAQLIINNIIHPDLPLRNNISNILFSIIAVLIFINSLRDAYFSDTFADGLKAGFWSGISSGAIACLTAMVLIVFGMKYILLDPLKLQEWSEVAETSGSPGMAVYYAYRTFSGAIMHLFILGALMGSILGIFGGLAGKIFYIIRKLNTK